jgi:hypothetical protein
MITADALWFAAIGAVVWGIICTYAAIHYARKKREYHLNFHIDDSTLEEGAGWTLPEHAIISGVTVHTTTVAEAGDMTIDVGINEKPPTMPDGPMQFDEGYDKSWHDDARKQVVRRTTDSNGAVTVAVINDEDCASRDCASREVARRLEKFIGGGAQVDPDSIMIDGEYIGETLVGRREPYSPIRSIPEYRGVVAGAIASKVKVGDEVWIGDDACRITWVGLPDEEGNVGMHATRVSMVARRPVTWEECATCQHNGGECDNSNAIIGPSPGRERCTGYVEVLP